MIKWFLHLCVSSRAAKGRVIIVIFMSKALLSFNQQQSTLRYFGCLVVLKLALYNSWRHFMLNEFNCTHQIAPFALVENILQSFCFQNLLFQFFLSWDPNQRFLLENPCSTHKSPSRKKLSFQYFFLKNKKRVFIFVIGQRENDFFVSPSF